MRDDEEVFVEPYTYDGDDLEEVHIDNDFIEDPEADETINEELEEDSKEALKDYTDFEPSDDYSEDDFIDPSDYKDPSELSNRIIRSEALRFLSHNKMIFPLTFLKKDIRFQREGRLRYTCCECGKDVLFSEPPRQYLFKTKSFLCPSCRKKIVNNRYRTKIKEAQDGR